VEAAVSGTPTSGAIHVDELQPKLNPVEQADLAQILSMTPYRRRVAVMLAFAEMSQAGWSAAAGLEERAVARWLRGDYRMPLGAALRLARVIGVDPIQVFAVFLN
jgi:hypothetical protein